MNFAATILDRVTMYRLMLYFLSVVSGVSVFLSFFGILPYSYQDILLQTIAFVFLCLVFNTAISRILRVKPNIESSVITALILSLIVGPVSIKAGWPVFLLVSFAAILSKYLFTLKKSHILNPAAFGALAGSLFLGSPASWWVGSNVLLPFILVGGLIVIYKVRRFHLIFSFLAVYFGFLVLGLLQQGLPLSGVSSVVQNLLLNSPILFFSFVMLPEPLTSPQTSRRRVYFGSFIGFILFTLQRFLSQIPYLLEVSLLLGNVFSRILSPDFRQAFSLRKKEFLSSSIANFWFEPVKKFKFKAGQFLEYTLYHSRSDSRGIRRYFTIASSPTEKNVLLTTRFSDRSSTFKKRLRQMDNASEIVASKVAGDFILPRDNSLKLVFIAGGIGVTPFRSMIKYLLDNNESRDIILLYSAKLEGDLVFKDIFEEAKQRFGMKIIYILSDSQNFPKDWRGRVGMIDSQLIKEEVKDFTDRIFYVSGPEPMVRSIEKILKSVGIAKRKIKRDYFPGYRG